VVFAVYVVIPIVVDAAAELAGSNATTESKGRSRILTAREQQRNLPGSDGTVVTSRLLSTREPTSMATRKMLNGEPDVASRRRRRPPREHSRADPA
jgi:hypothetical protein